MPGFYYWLNRTKQKEKILLETEREYLERSKSFPKENSQLSREQHQLKVNYQRLQSELAILWYQVAKRCSSRREAKCYYEKAAQLGYSGDPHELVVMAWGFIHDFARNTKHPCTPEEQAKYYEIVNQYLTHAMEQDHADAFYKKGIQYQKGWGELENQELALKYFRAAAKRGLREAIYAIDEDYIRRYSHYEEMWISKPELLARIILDANLGVRQAKKLLRKIIKENPLTGLENLSLQRLLFSLMLKLLQQQDLREEKTRKLKVELFKQKFKQKYDEGENNDPDKISFEIKSVKEEEEENISSEYLSKAKPTAVKEENNNSAKDSLEEGLSEEEEENSVSTKGSSGEMPAEEGEEKHKSAEGFLGQPPVEKEEVNNNSDEETVEETLSEESAPSVHTTAPSVNPKESAVLFGQMELIQLLFNAVEKGYLLVLEVSLHALEVLYPQSYPLLFEVLIRKAIEAYARETLEIKKNKIKKCIHFFFFDKNAKLSLDELFAYRIYDVDILTWKLEHPISDQEMGFNIALSDCSPVFALKLLTSLSSSSFDSSALFSLTEGLVLHNENPPMLQAILRLLENPQTEDEKSALYEAQGGHNALAVVLRFLYLMALKCGDIATCKSLRKEKMSFHAENYFLKKNSEIYHFVEQEVVGQRNLDVLRVLIQSPFTPTELSLQNLIEKIADLIYPLITPTAKNIKIIEALLGTKDGDLISLKTGFLSALINYLFSIAINDEHAFEFILALIKTDSEIIRAAILVQVHILIGTLFVSYQTAKGIFLKLSQLLQGKIFDNDSYQQLFYVVNPSGIGTRSFYDMLIRLFIAVKQDIPLNDEQKRIVTYNHRKSFFWTNVDCHFQEEEPIIKELLVSAESSAFWQVVKFEQEQHHRSHDRSGDASTARIHTLRRTHDDSYNKFRSALNAIKNPLVLDQLILQDNFFRLGHECDYLFLLEENKQSPEKALALLYICQRRHIDIPKVLIKELVKTRIRHPMIEFLRELKNVNLQVTKALLIDITNNEDINAVHNKKNRRYLSAVFRKKNGWLSPNPNDKSDAIARAYALLTEVDQALLSTPTALPRPLVLNTSATTDGLESKVESSVPSIPEGKNESWPKQKSLSDAQAMANNSSFLRKPTSEEIKDEKETAVINARMPGPHPVRGDADND